MSESAQKQTMGFQAEVKQLLQLVTHSLYSHEEIFLRELISNSSDALDKLRFETLADDSLMKGDADLNVQIDFDKNLRTLTITDNGIGMNRDEVIDNLGTIAKSGTHEFLASLSGEQAKDSHMIGQFGVGFYSAFIVADKVAVTTRRAGLAADDAILWISDGSGEFTIEQVSKAERGTTIVLHIKEDKDEFLDEWRLKNIITKYSDHISFPVMMAEAPATPEEGEDEKVVSEIPAYKAVNKAKALWTLAKKDITDEEYKEFYKHISHDFEDPLLWGHNRVEGKLEYTSLLYIPSHAPFDLWNRDTPRGLKLYVQRVFIMDNADKLLPLYLRFVKGVIDSNDLPLNVSRELLQNNKVIESIKAATTKRILGMLEKMAKDDTEAYTKFWAAFGTVIKEGPGEDFSNKDTIAKLIRVSTTKAETEEQTVSLADYVARMKPDQEKIYYITADGFAAAKNSPHLEIFRKKDIEVILLHERVDEWLVSHLNEFDGKQFESVAKGDLDLGKLEDEKDKEEQEKVEAEFKDFVTRVKDALGEQVKEVRVTHRLTNSPACIVADENGMSGNIQRILMAAGQEVQKTQPILELNPEHSIIKKVRDEKGDDCFKEWSQLLLDQSVLAEGGQLDDPGAFVVRMNELLLK